jgi:hypothetical protein
LNKIIHNINVQKIGALKGALCCAWSQIHIT